MGWDIGIHLKRRLLRLTTTGDFTMGWDIGIHLKGHSFEDTHWHFTHNTNELMRAAGYDWVYHLNGKKVITTLPKFKAMLANLKSNPDKYCAMLSPLENEVGWTGPETYQNLVLILSVIIKKAESITADIPQARWWEFS